MYNYEITLEKLPLENNFPGKHPFPQNFPRRKIPPLGKLSPEKFSIGKFPPQRAPS